MSEAEWEVMRVVWTYGDVTSRQIIDILGDEYQWSPSTIKTLLKRLVDKQYLSVRKDGKVGHYTATITEREMGIEKLQQDLSKICTTKQASFVLDLLQQIPLSKSDAQAIISLLDERLPNLPEHVSCHCHKGQCQCQKGCDCQHEN